MKRMIKESQQRQRHHWWQTPICCQIRDLSQRRIFWPWCKQFCASRLIKGLDNLEDLNQPVIFVANHASHADTVMILSALPTALRQQVAIAAARDYFYKSPFRAAIISLLLNTVPFDRESGSSSLLECSTLLDEGWSLLLYPEGTRSLDGTIARFKKGVGSLASRLDVAVVPIYIEGSGEILPKGALMPKKNDVRITFGKPVKYGSEARLGWIASDLRQRIIALQEEQHLPQCA